MSLDISNCMKDIIRLEEIMKPKKEELKQLNKMLQEKKSIVEQYCKANNMTQISYGSYSIVLKKESKKKRIGKKEMVKILSGIGIHNGEHVYKTFQEVTQEKDVIKVINNGK